MNDCKLIGLVGYARAGKDTAAANMPGWYRMAFADRLKADLKPLLDMVGCDLTNPDHKERARGLLVAWGETAREFDPRHWISVLLIDLSIVQPHRPNVIITDVRYPNEVQAILNLEGTCVRIHRPSYNAANLEEAGSIERIDRMWPEMPAVVNDGTPEELGKKVLEAANGK